MANKSKPFSEATIENILYVAAQGYPEPEMITGNMTAEERHCASDGLAAFIAGELKSIHDPFADEHINWFRAAETLQVAANQLQTASANIYSHAIRIHT